MGRSFPVGENASIHPFISTSFLIACIAATIAVISSMCGALSRKKSQPSPHPPGNDGMKENRDPNASFPEGSPGKGMTVVAVLDSDNNGVDISQQNGEEELSQQPLPPPPGRRHLSGATSYHTRSDSSSSQTSKLPSSLSMRALGNGLSSRQGSKREDGYAEKKKEKNLKHEDSIWKKTIILGDKCRVPDEDEDTILYDEKGNRISTYHRKNANSFALSRQSSAIDPDAVPAKGQQETE